MHMEIREEYIDPIELKRQQEEERKKNIEKYSNNSENKEEGSQVESNEEIEYKKRTGRYPKRILVDQIYRNKANINYCNERNIRISGVPLSRQKLLTQTVDKKIIEKDNKDRIEVERKFSLAKRKFGLGKIWTKLENTTKASIVLSILAMNINSILNFYIYILKICVLSKEEALKVKI